MLKIVLNSFHNLNEALVCLSSQQSMRRCLGLIKKNSIHLVNFRKKTPKQQQKQQQQQEKHPGENVLICAWIVWGSYEKLKKRMIKDRKGGGG